MYELGCIQFSTCNYQVVGSPFKILVLLFIITIIIIIIIIIINLIIIIIVIIIIIIIIIIISISILTFLFTSSIYSLNIDGVGSLPIVYQLYL